MTLLAGCGPLPEGEPAVTAVTSVPTGLNITQTTSTSITLAWMPSTGEVFSYTIYRNGIAIGHTSRAGLDTVAPTTFVDTGLSPLTSYYYTVASASVLGVESQRTDPVIAVTLQDGSVSTGPPVATVSQTTANSITINWTPSGIVPYLVNYRIYRNGNLIATTTATTYVDANLAPGTTYSYTITMSTESPQSTQVIATTQQAGSGTPTSPKVISTLAGTAGTRKGSVDGVGGEASFSVPYGIAGSGGFLYVTDGSSNTIRKIDVASGMVTTLAGMSGSYGYSDGVGTGARFNGPRGIATDGTNLYVADSNNHTIRKVVIATGEVTTIAGTPGTRGSSNGYGPQASFYTPRGVVLDGGILYVADSSNHLIRKVEVANGGVGTVAGTAGRRGKIDGKGTAASFYLPYGIACYGGKLYVADTCNHTIRAIDIATGQVTTLAGVAGTAGTYDGFGTGAFFTYPDGLAAEGTALYVADSGNNTIRRIALDSTEVATIAGVPGSSGSVDSTGSYGKFFAPHGVVVLDGKLYVSDTNNNTIRQVLLDQL